MDSATITWYIRKVCDYSSQQQKKVRKWIKNLQWDAQGALQSYRYCRPTRLPVKDQKLDPAPQIRLLINVIQGPSIRI